MKKLFLVGLIILMIIPNAVSAATFSNGNTNYVIEESSLRCSLDQDARLTGITDDYYFFESERDEYKLDFDGNCSTFSNQDYLDLISTGGYNEWGYRYRESDDKIIEYWQDYGVTNFFKTEDTIIDPEKEYYIAGFRDYEQVLNPQISNIDNYYEKSYFKAPTSTIIDNDITYYEWKDSLDGFSIPGYFQKVENPTSEGMFSETRLKYLIKSEVDGYEEKVVTAVDRTKFPAGSISDVLGWDDKIFLKIEDKIYDLNGNLIEEFEGAQWISTIGNDLLLVGFNSADSKFYNYNYEELYIQRDAYHMGNIGNVHYLGIKFDNHVYELRIYQEKNETAHNFNNNDLTFTFSGDYTRLNSVKVNDVELDVSNYTKASGSTIITLNKDYLKSLDKGTYTLKVGYNDGGSATTTFEIPEANPQTSDGIMSSIILGSISLIGLFGASIYLKKKKI